MWTASFCGLFLHHLNQYAREGTSQNARQKPAQLVFDADAFCIIFQSLSSQTWDAIKILGI